MKYTAVRLIHFHSPETGLVSKYVAKEIVSEIPPQLGYVVDDTAWHRDDRPKIEEVEIEASSGACTVQLEPIAAKSAEAVDRAFDVVLSHDGWKDWLK
ncbi:hypothetical protein NPS53_09660 [Pseudomonas putida]|uniref:hypothetical protein n=1 Tax=Pseudomonas putida TaxID=303 RepID=UPI0023638DDF|nr:hypothetical protein [Pseudomonas putida]MDD2139844.1 hypothetical protein [Pseudomonas putida]HDS1721767.1 hypothetical protein [Pseudomonas putida]